MQEQGFKKVAHIVWDEIKTGKNIDVYIMLFIAGGATVLALLGWIPYSILIPVISAILAMLAVASLINRQRVEKILENLSSFNSTVESNTKAIDAISRGQVASSLFFQTRDTRPSIKTFVRNAKSLDIMGTSLSSFSSFLQSELRTLKQSGANIRLILSNSEDYHLQELYAKRYLETESADDHRKVLQLSLENFRKLVGRDNSGGSIEVRVTDCIQGFGYIGVNAPTQYGQIQVEIYLNKIPLSRNPIFTLNASDDTHWYNEYQNQFDFYWKNATDPYESDKA